MATVTVSFTMDETAYQNAVAALAGTYGYQATLTNGSPNPQTQEQFAQQQIVAFVSQVAVAWNARQGSAAAVAAAQQAAQQQAQAAAQGTTVTAVTNP